MVSSPLVNVIVLSVADAFFKAKLAEVYKLAVAEFKDAVVAFNDAVVAFNDAVASLRAVISVPDGATKVTVCELPSPVT